MEGNCRFPLDEVEEVITCSSLYHVVWGERYSSWDEDQKLYSILSLTFNSTFHSLRSLLLCYHHCLPHHHLKVANIYPCTRPFSPFLLSAGSKDRNHRMKVTEMRVKLRVLMEVEWAVNDFFTSPSLLLWL